MHRARIDWHLFLPIIFLTLLGLLIIRSVAPQLFLIQLLFFGVSLTVFVLFSHLDYKILFSLPLPIYVLSILFLLLPYPFGIVSHGAIRWLQIGQFSLQPSEIIKPFLFIVFSWISTHPTLKRQPMWLLGSLAIPSSLIFFQPDLGSSLVLSFGWLPSAIFRVTIKTVFAFGIVALLFSGLAYRFVLHDYQRSRLETFINPYSDPRGRGYHVIQSVIAVGSGKILGRGLGQGTQSQLRFLPEHHTDFIFASLSEELGLLGSLTVLVLYLWLFWRIYVISQQSQDPHAAICCTCALSMLAFQVFVNIGMNIGLAPVTGITLPFISYGGSSLLSLGILLGIISSISGANSSHLAKFQI